MTVEGQIVFILYSLQRCDLAGGDGICCKEPPIDVNPPVVQCTESGAICKPTGYCSADSLSAPEGYTQVR